LPSGAVSLSLDWYGIKDETFTTKNDNKEFFRVLDFDNDGKSDLLISDPRYYRESNWIGQEWGEEDGHAMYWLRSTGNYFIMEKLCRIDDGIQQTKHITSGDFDGDGSADILNWGLNLRNGDDKALRLHLYKNSTYNTQSDKIISVTNGLGRKDEIEYAPLNDESVYTPSTSTDAKLMETRHLSVVKSITSNADNSYRNKETFKYTGSRIHREGKGFMCFEKMEKFNENSGLTEVKVSEVNTKYYVPSVIEQNIVDRNQSALASTTNNIVFHQLSGKAILVKTTEAEKVDNVTGVTTRKTGVVDGNGNTTSEKTLYGNDVTENVSYTYGYAKAGTSSRWSVPNKVKSKKVTTTYNGATAHTVETKY
jgi:hypothetical protein